MQILILGRVGQLGWELLRTLGPLGEIRAVDYPEIDLSSANSIRAVLQNSRPQVVINATAYTNVDGAEKEPDKAMAINGFGPGILMEEARRISAAVIHYSTDYVFDGKAGRPYLETDVPHPLGVYGQSKLAGERWIQGIGESYLIFRTSWLYSTRRPSFVTKVLEWSRSQKELRVVDDQIGNPTWARALAEATAQVLAQAQACDDPVAWIQERRGLYHLAGSGYTSRYEWARMVLGCDPYQEQQVVEQVIPAKTADFPTPAERPLFSALSCETFKRVFHLTLPEWQDALKLAME